MRASQCCSDYNMIIPLHKNNQSESMNAQNAGRLFLFNQAFAQEFSLLFCYFIENVCSFGMRLLNNSE